MIIHRCDFCYKEQPTQDTPEGWIYVPIFKRNVLLCDECLAKTREFDIDKILNLVINFCGIKRKQ